eukprot:2552224-Heterocapsa_arctica.AAC.1
MEGDPGQGAARKSRIEEGGKGGKAEKHSSVGSNQRGTRVQRVVSSAGRGYNVGSEEDPRLKIYFCRKKTLDRCSSRQDRTGNRFPRLQDWAGRTVRRQDRRRQSRQIRQEALLQERQEVVNARQGSGPGGRSGGSDVFVVLSPRNQG